MSPIEIFIDPETKLLRSGWRLLVFLVLFMLPGLIFRGPADESTFEIGWGMLVSYAALIAWTVFLSWLCLKLLDRFGLASLGVAPYRGWWREVLIGCAVSAVMTAAVVGLQALGGGTRLMLNPLMWKSAEGARVIDYAGLLIVARRVGAALVLLILAGAFEELLFRGYPFQTLLRGAPVVVPLLLLSLFFGMAHWRNPNRTIFSTVNTVLAGVWLSAAYLRTRGLWFPLGLHFMWNWMLGAFFGLPVSGMKLPSSPVFVSTSEAPVWLTGGSYGSEGGAAATIVLVIAIFLIWRARWLRVSPEMQALLEQRSDEPESQGLGVRG